MLSGFVLILGAREFRGENQDAGERESRHLGEGEIAQLLVSTQQSVSQPLSLFAFVPHFNYQILREVSIYTSSEAALPALKTT